MHEIQLNNSVIDRNIVINWLSLNKLIGLFSQSSLILSGNKKKKPI